MKLAPSRFRSLEPVRLLGIDALAADSVPSRLLGLALLDYDPELPPLLFRRCSSVHTFGMRFPLDICLIDRSGDVLAWHKEVGPGRLVGAIGARCVLELPPDHPSGEAGERNGRPGLKVTRCFPSETKRPR